MEEAYLDRIRRFILFHGKRHPSESGVPQIEALVTDLSGSLSDSQRPAIARERPL